MLIFVDGKLIESAGRRGKIWKIGGLTTVAALSVARIPVAVLFSWQLKGTAVKNNQLPATLTHKKEREKLLR